jgi:uncharacterized protein with FMN-binding domain
LLVLVGVGGLIGLLGYHPKAVSVGGQASHTPQPSSTPSSDPSTGSGGSSTAYKDGTYTGTTVDVGYGPVQVQAVILGGKLTTVNFLQMPNDRQHSQEITDQAEPLLRQEAIQAQSANIDTVSGATQDSDGFVESLQAALALAKA